MSKDFMVRVGGKAPSFCLKDENGDEHCLKDYLGRRVVIYFYPRDNTPGCTIEANDFTKLKSSFDKEGVVILGANSDSSKSHKKFSEKRKLKITLLSDEDSSIQKKFGVWKKKKFMGREYMGTDRSTFLIGENGKILKIWESVSVLGHAKKVLEFVKVV
jgi:peroxiredoxin Q/BCP